MRPNPLLPGAWSRSGLARALLCAALLLGGLAPGQALAGTTVSLFNSFAGNINFVTTGNTLRANDNNTNACSLLSGLTGTAVNAGTSSGTVSGIPAGSTIVAAYLYYAGSSSTVDNAVTFNGTGVSASRTFTDTTIVPFFGGFVDVTSLVTGNATYSFTGLTVDNSATYCGNQTVLAGWALVVIYSKSTEAYRVINIYDGFQAFQNSSITLTPANFKVPNPPIAGSKFAVITWEGDPTLSGNETLSFNGTVLTDACNGTNNQYNSTINTLLCTGNAATDDVFYGVDIDTFGVDSFVSAGQTSATTFYQSGGDAVMLAAQIISITDAPVSDLSISKVHNGTFGYGDNGTYTISVTNNGPTATSGTTTVSDTLPTGETYVSATGTGWTCGAAGQVVTCTNTSAIANGASFNPITLTVAVATSAGTSLANTATVSVDPADFDNVSGNNSSTDTVSNGGGTLVHPDLSTSTKDVAVTTGGDANPGDTLQYTITLNETNGVAASNVSVMDNVPANMSGFTASAVTVSGSTTTPTNSSTNTGGTNNDGLVSVSNITVPANGSVTIVFTAQVKAGTANCTTINNGATITYAGGSPTTQTPTAPTIIVAQSNCAASGNKILYAYDNLSLSRTKITANGAGVNINGANGTATWALSPVIATGKTLVLPAQTINISLICQATNNSVGTNRAITVQLLNGATSMGTSGSVNCRNGPTVIPFTITTAGTTTIAAGTAISMVVKNTNGTAANHISIFQMNATTGTALSTITFSTSTVINVDSVTAYNAAYAASTQNPVYAPSGPVYICAVVSDPFGSYDATSATITITDPNGTVQVSGATMNAMGAGDCTQSAGSLVAPTADETFEYTYTPPLPGTAVVGFWTASVTAKEGTENTITHTANGAFDVDLPSLMILKSVSVSTDPTGDAIKHSIPGAAMLYTIQVQNNGRGPVAGGTMVITDPIPANTAFYWTTATGKFGFTDGSTASGVGAPTVTFSNNGGSTYLYSPSCTPTPTVPCTDTAITNVKFTFPNGMVGKTGASAPSFTVTFTVLVN